MTTYTVLIQLAEDFDTDEGPRREFRHVMAESPEEAAQKAVELCIRNLVENHHEDPDCNCPEDFIPLLVLEGQHLPLLEMPNTEFFRDFDLHPFLDLDSLTDEVHS